MFYRLFSALLYCRPEYVSHRGQYLVPLDRSEGVTENQKDDLRATGAVARMSMSKRPMSMRNLSSSTVPPVGGSSASTASSPFGSTVPGMSSPNTSVDVKYEAYDRFSAFDEVKKAQSNVSPLWNAGDAGGEDPDQFLYPTPLSPDALSGFSKYDPDAQTHNFEIHQATDRLLHKVIPAVAVAVSKQYIIAELYKESKRNGNKRLKSSNPPGKVEVPVIALKGAKLTQYLHKNGVNMRHLGLLRQVVHNTMKTSIQTYTSFVSTEGFNTQEVHPTTVHNAILLLERELLMQVLTRNAKNVLRSFQRKWMKNEQSTSVEGMKILITQFLNLLCGSHSNATNFWDEYMCLGICQRFGCCALLYAAEREGLLAEVAGIPWFLQVV